MSDYPKIEVPESCCEGMKNEDLEIINEKCKKIRMLDVDYSDEDLYEIQRAASRMAAEIERLKKHEKELNVKLSLYNTAYWEHPSGDMTGTKQLQEMNAEIARLKAELEKRPEVVRCGECKKKDLGFTCPLVCANAVIKAKTKAENFILFDDNDFCSAGKRRESEVGE